MNYELCKHVMFAVTPVSPWVSPHPLYFDIHMFKLYLIKCAWLTLPTVSHTDTWAVLTPPVPCYSNLCQFLSLLFSLNPSSCPFPFFFFLSPPNVHLSQDSPPLDSRCCYCYTCTTHRPSFLPLHSASPAAQVLPSHPHPVPSPSSHNLLLLLSSCFVLLSLP